MKASLEHIESMSASLQESGLPSAQAKAIVAAVADTIDRFAMPPEKVEQRIVQERVFYGPKFDELRSDIDGLKSDFRELRSDFGVLQGEVGVLKSDVAVLKTDMAELKARVAIIENDVAVIKNILTEHTQAFKDISDRLLHAERAAFRYFFFILLSMIGTMVSIRASAMFF